MKSHIFYTGLVSIGFLLLSNGCSYKHSPDYKVEKPQVNQANNSFYNLGRVNVSTMLPKSGFYPLMDAPNALAARLLLMENAKKSIDLQYYEILDDDVGRLIYKAALDAADRGVKVRILLDDIGLKGKDEKLAALDMHPKIEIKVFNPTYYRNTLKKVEMGLRAGTVGRRMHNKTFNVDNSAIIMGGRNLAVEYFGFDQKKIFLDNDLLIIGPVASQLTYEFDTYWNSEKVYGYDVLTTIHKKRLAEIRKGLDTFEINIKGNSYKELLDNCKFRKDFYAKNLDLIFGDAKLLYDAPEKITTDAYNNSTHLMRQLAPYIRTAKKSLRIVNPYFVPNDQVMDLFKELRSRGVEIHVLTNSLPSADAPYVYAFYKEYQKPLLDLGVNLHEVKTSAFREDEYSHKLKEKTGHFLEIQLHGKTMLIDDETLIIGSMNLDPRSAYQNTEIVAVVKNKELAEKEKKRYFDVAFDLKNSFKLELETKPGYKDSLTGEEVSGDKKLVWISEDQDGNITKFYNDAGASFMKRLEANVISWFPVKNEI